MVQYRIKWKSPANTKEVALEDIHQAEWSHQVEDQESPQLAEELQELDKLELPQQSEKEEASEHAMTPPPGFKPLLKSQIKTNLTRPRVPYDPRLFPDLEQLIVIANLTKGEPVVLETFPSPASLQESHTVQELQTSYAQQNNSEYAPGTDNSMLEPDGPRTVCVEFSSTEQLKLLTPITSGYGHQNGTPHDSRKQNVTEKKVVCNGRQTDGPEPFHLQQHGPTSMTINSPFPGFLTSPVRPNYSNLPDFFEQSHTLQAEFLSSEQIKSTDVDPIQAAPRYESLPMPQNHQPPTQDNIFQNQNIPMSNPNNHHPLMPTLQRTPLFRYETPNFVPTYPVQNRPVFQSFAQFGWTPPGFGQFPPRPHIPPLFRVPFVNNGITFYPPQMQPPHPPPMGFPRFSGSSPTNSPNQRTMQSPNCMWNNQNRDSIQSFSNEHNIPLPPKKVLEIRSPTCLKQENIPHAANLSDEVKESLSTSNTAVVNSNESMDIQSSKKTGKLSPQTDFSNGSFDERPNAFSQSTSSLKNDSTGKLVSTDDDSYTEDSLDEGEQEYDALQPVLDDAVEKCDPENDESCLEKDSLEELAGSNVQPQSSTNPVAENSLNPVEDLLRQPSLEKNGVEVKNPYTCNQRRFITTIDVAGKSLNVFWIEGHPYLEVEVLLGFGKLRPPVALKIIKTKSIFKKLFELKVANNAEIFDEMANLGVCHANHMISPSTKLLLIKLYDVSELLSTINVSDASYMKELHLQVYLHSIG